MFSGAYVPVVMSIRGRGRVYGGSRVTSKLKSYGAAKREMLPGIEHRQSCYLNNRCENSRRPTRQRERHVQGFKSSGHAQRLLSAYGPIAQHFGCDIHVMLVKRR
jgi:putative transposase